MQMHNDLLLDRDNKSHLVEEKDMISLISKETACTSNEVVYIPPKCFQSKYIEQIQNIRHFYFIKNRNNKSLAVEKKYVSTGRPTKRGNLV